MKPLFLFASLFLMAGVLPGCTVLFQPGVDEGATSRRRQETVDFSDPVLNQRRILVFGKITEATAEDVMRKMFYLDAQNDGPISLYLMSPGGDLKAAFAIENAMHLVRSPINTYALSECNSGGAVLLAAGTGERAAFRNAVVVIHGMKVRGKPPPGAVETFQDFYTAFWRRRAKLPAQWLPIPPDKPYVLTSEQALEYGVVDKIIER